MIAASEGYIESPEGLHDIIKDTFLSYKVILIICGSILGCCALTFLFCNVFVMIHWTFSLCIYIAYSIANALLGSFIGLIKVNDVNHPILSRIPYYPILFIFVILNFVLLIIALVVSCLGWADKFAAGIRTMGMKATETFRIILNVLSIVVFFAAIFSLGGKWVFPVGIIVFIMDILILLLHLVIINEIFDKRIYQITKRNPIELAFYLLASSSSIIFINIVLLPTIGIRFFSNETLINNFATNSKNQTTVGSKSEIKQKKTKTKVKIVTTGLKHFLF